MKVLFYCLTFLLLLTTCTTKNDGEPDDASLYIKLLGGSKDDTINDAFINEAGEIVGTGTTKSFVNVNETTNMFLFKTDKFGNKIWHKNFSGLEGNCILPTHDGNYLVLGTEPSSPSINKKIKFWKINADGSLQTEKLIATNQNITGLSLGVLPNNATTPDYIILGNWQKISNTNNIEETRNYFSRIDNNGTVKFDKTYFLASYQNNTPRVMRTLPTGESIIAGSVNGLARLLSLDSDLGINWDYFYNADDVESVSEFTDMQITGNGYICAGNTITIKTMPFIVKTDFAGNTIWKKTLDLGSNVSISSVSLATDGGYMLTGAVDIKTSESTNTNIWVGKLSSTGDLEWQKDFGSKRNDVGKCIRTVTGGECVILGEITFETNKMIAIIRMDKNGNLIK